MFVDKATRGEKISGIKLTAVSYGILLMMLALAAGLWRLQVLGASNFRVLAEQNRIRKVPILAARGKLFDREDRLIVDNYPSVSCFLVREQNHNVDADLPLIARGLNLDLNQLRATLQHYRLSPGYQPIPIKQDITADEQAFIEAHRNELPELETIDEARRLYPRDGFAAHLIGYVGEVSEEMLNDPRYAAYEPGDVVGKAGVEESYDQLLRGQDGSRDVIVDSHGREVGYLGIQHAVPGKDLRLTIDNDLQHAAELALGGREGAIVAMDPRNGEILAMVSRPSFDPNEFAVRIDRADWNKLITDPEHPLMNKSIQAQLAPGSTFKILMSVAGLQEGIAQDMHIVCNGGWGPYGFFHHCDEHHGAVDIHNAIPYSCDTFYYMLGDKLGIDRISKYATEFGYGQKTGIDLPGEQAGLMPSVDWLLKNFHHRWYPDETLDVAIGQGAVEATPIQLARIIGGIASGGHMVRPHSVFPDQLPEDFRRALEDTYPGSGKADIPIDPENWQIITDGMAEVTQPALYHTAGSAHLEGIDLAGKTGTAQLMSHEALGKTGKGMITRPNVWFVGVTPRRNPELVVAVLWQNGEFSYYPARIGAQVVAAYVEKQRRLAHNLAPPKTAAEKPVEVGAVWTTPETGANGTGGKQTARLHAGHFLVYPGDATKGEMDAQNLLAPLKRSAKANPGRLPAPGQPVPEVKRLGAMLAELPLEEAMSPVRRFLSFRDFDWALLGMVLVLCVISVFEIYSATFHTRFASFPTKQVFWIAGGLAVMFLLAKIDYHRLLDWTPWAYGVFVLSLVAVKAVGHKVLGARRWISVGPVQFQPSEWVKLVLILVVARYFANLGGRNLTWRDIFKAFALVGVPMALVLIQPDLGTTLTYAPILVAGLFLGGINLRQALILSTCALVLVAGVWTSGKILKPYQKARLTSFINPDNDPKGSGYQIRQSLIAVGSGGIWGKGAEKGTQTQGYFLPIPYTDFIFAAYSEEHGFVGAILVLLLYFLILMRLIQNAQTAADLSGSLIIMGIVAVLTFQIAVNVGMVIGFMPVTGIPLPLMSYGGSSVLFTFLALGVAMNVRMRRFVN